MIENFNGGPVGLDTMAAATGEDSQTIEEVYEPYLLQIGYLQRTPRGRIATPAAWRHLGYDVPERPTLVMMSEPGNDSESGNNDDQLSLM